MNRALRAPLCLLLLLFLGACASPRNYHGYKYKPYTIGGTPYYPLEPHEALGFKERGIASHYREGFWLFPGNTSLGEKFRAGALEGAHKTLPIPCRVRVTNLRNGKQIIVRINDRGPFIEGRIIDLTPSAARKLGFFIRGTTPVEIEVISVGDGRYRIH